jgi:F0F1-type ATP synthase membrane subunit b/b'
MAANQALKNLAETSANLAVELAGKVIRESINPAKQQELVRHALERLNASNN